MPWRLIQFIAIFAVFLLITAFNLKNKCNINFGFATLEDVPVYLTAFSAFALGMLCALPYIIKGRLKSKSGQPPDTVEKKPAKARGKKKYQTDDTPEESSFSDGGPYGVN